MYHDVGIIAIDPIKDSDFHEDIFNFNLSIDETFLGNTCWIYQFSGLP